MNKIEIGDKPFVSTLHCFQEQLCWRWMVWTGDYATCFVTLPRKRTFLCKLSLLFSTYLMIITSGKTCCQVEQFCIWCNKITFCNSLGEGGTYFVANYCGDLEIVLRYKWRRVTNIRHGCQFHWNASHPAQPLRAMSNTLLTWQTRGDYHRCEILWCPLICIVHMVDWQQMIILVLIHFSLADWPGGWQTVRAKAEQENRPNLHRDPLHVLCQVYYLLTDLISQ